MEHLIIHLKEKLITRRSKELERFQKMNREHSKELVFISSGKILELDFLIKCLDELIAYQENTKKIAL